MELFYQFSQGSPPGIRQSYSESALIIHRYENNEHTVAFMLMYDP